MTAISELKLVNSTPKLLGIFGGTFDPVHNGHLVAARAFLNDFALEQVLMVPCHDPVHKSKSQAPGHHRLQMLKSAITDDPKLIASDIELTANTGSYTVDTLQLVKQRYTEHTLVFAMGTDSYRQLSSWRDVDEILSLCHIVVLSRPGHNHAVNPDFPDTLLSKNTNTQTVFLHQNAGRIILHDINALAVSSSGVRSALLQGQRVNQPIPEPVSRYIKQHGLYTRLK